MTPLLLTVALAVGAEAKADGPDVEGKWLIVYAEEGGRRNTTWEQQVATLKGDMLSYSKEGEERSLRLKFGADQKLTATLSVGGKAAAEGKSLDGVFIAGQDYLCLSLNAAGKGGDAKGGGSKPAFILILRRQR
jgi:hypothetical protein